MRWSRWSAVVPVACSFGCGGEGGPQPEAPACTIRATDAEIAIGGNDSFDVLLVLDRSPSMAEEQPALARELEKLIRMLVAGASTPEGYRVPPVHDLHVAVISSDLGAGSMADVFPGCTAVGDGAVFQHTGSAPGCAGPLPPFADYFVHAPTQHPLVPPPEPDAADALVRDVICAADLDLGGCELSQPLEAAVRALTPGIAPNAGFLRNDPKRGLSMIWVLLISDGDDSSLRAVDHYVDELKALRPGNEQLVAMTAIIGLPSGVPAPAERRIDWEDARARDAYYAELLADPSMHPTPLADGTLPAVCQTEHARAEAAPRIVEAVRALGRNGRLQSICAADWSSAVLDQLDDWAPVGDSGCFNLLASRAPDGLMRCRLLWELPLAKDAPRGTPINCDAYPFLSVPADPPQSRRGGPVCEVHQLAVQREGDAVQLEDGGGWFYDDFTARGDCRCLSFGRTCNNVTFVPHRVPPGILVRAQCQEEHYTVPVGAVLGPAPQPDVFDACDPDRTDACDRVTDNRRGGARRIDTQLTCDRERRQCVLSCASRGCPAGWTCGPDKICEPGECRVPG